MFRLISRIVSSPKMMLFLVVIASGGLIYTQSSPSGFSVDLPGLPLAGERKTVEPGVDDLLDTSPVQLPGVPTPTATPQLTPATPGDAPGDAPTPEPVSTATNEDETEMVLRPSAEWINVYGESAVLNMQPVQPGDVITAYDASGTLAGRFVVEIPGQYGVMAIYKDDPSTTVDEGTEPGDQISFAINGLPASVLGPEQPRWNESGTLLLLNLVAGQTSIQVGP